MITKQNKLLFGLLAMGLGLVLVAPRTVLAQATPSSGSGLVQCGDSVDNPCTVEDVFNTFVIATNYLIDLVGLVAIVSIVWAGFSMITAAGRQDALTSAKHRLTYSIVGLILVLLAFVIVNALLAGSINIGVRNGADILLNPGTYVKTP